MAASAWSLAALRLQVGHKAFGRDPAHRIARVKHPPTTTVAQRKGQRGGDLVGSGQGVVQSSPPGVKRPPFAFS
jgi:hypothetical protein